jgi:hypothetical protein
MSFRTLTNKKGHGQNVRDLLDPSDKSSLMRVCFFYWGRITEWGTLGMTDWGSLWIKYWGILGKVPLIARHLQDWLKSQFRSHDSNSSPFHFCGALHHLAVLQWQTCCGIPIVFGNTRTEEYQP